MNAVFQSARRAAGGRRTTSLVVAGVVFLWSTSELINLSRVHTIGPEKYGVLVAAIAAGTGALSLGLLASKQTKLVRTAVVLALWGVVTLGGVGGTVAHIVGPEDGHGPVDTRSRPIAAPLIFTVLGIAGGWSLVFGQQLGLARVRELVSTDDRAKEVFPWLKQR